MVRKKTIRVNGEQLPKAVEICKSKGDELPDVIRMFIDRTVEQGGLPLRFDPLVYKMVKAKRYDDVYTVRIPEKQLQKAQDIFDATGLNFSEVIRMLVAQLIVDRDVPFVLKKDSLCATEQKPITEQLLDSMLREFQKSVDPKAFERILRSYLSGVVPRARERVLGDSDDPKKKREIDLQRVNQR